MGRVDVNMGDKEVSEFMLLPKGEYDLKIVEADLGKSKNSGHPQAVVNYVVVNSLNHEGQSLKFHRVTFIPDDGTGAWIAKAFLKALGLPYKGNISINTDQWIGKIIHAKVGIREYEGKEYNEVKEVSAYEGPEIKDKSSEEEVPF